MGGEVPSLIGAIALARRYHFITRLLGFVISHFRGKALCKHLRFAGFSPNVE